MSWHNDAPLKLQKVMERTYLIQRLHKSQDWGIGKIKLADNPFSFGGGLQNGGLSKNAMDLTRSIWSYDYMGSSEFEWGAVPKALSFLAEQASKHNLWAGQIEVGKNETVFYIAPMEYAEEVENRIQQLRKDEHKFNLKEGCRLKNCFDSTARFGKDTLGWLELDNGFMFFVDIDMFDKTCKLFGIGEKKS